MSSSYFRLFTLTAILLCSVPSRALEVRDFTFSHLGKAEGVDNQRIFSVVQSTSGAIWWSSMTGVGRYNGSQVRNYRLDANTPYSHLGGRVIHLATDSTAIYAFDNRGSIYLFSPLRNDFEQVVSLPAKIGHDVALNDIHVQDNRMYLALHDGVYLLQDTTLSRLTKDAYVNRIVPVKDRLLFCAREGIFDEQGRRLLPYNTECACYDELSDRLWLGGYEKGLHIVSFGTDNRVTSDDFIHLTGNAIQQNPIRSICPYDDETMLIGVDGEGVYQMRRDGRGECSLLFDANESEQGVLHGNAGQRTPCPTATSFSARRQVPL